MMLEGELIVLMVTPQAISRVVCVHPCSSVVPSPFTCLNGLRSFSSST
jgi:hypothetical protein